jgi:ABC-type branched-subunit amino acid transport system substrate-binding protein
MRQAVGEELDGLGIKLARQEAVVTNQSSFVAELSRIRDAGAKTVVILAGINEVIGILRDARALRYEPNWTGTYWAVDETTTPALMDGIKVIRNYATTNSPVYPAYVAKAKQYGRGDVTTSTSMALYGMGLFTGQVLQNAGPNLTRASLGPAIESIVNYNNQINMTLSFGKGVRVAEVGMWPAICCNADNTWRGTGEPKRRF